MMMCRAGTGRRQRVDKPLAALLRDLKQRGLLDETLVVWGGEFGRTADTNEANFNKKTPGRDHNPKAATMWFAGGGVRGGVCVGATDEVGEQAVEHEATFATFTPHCSIWPAWTMRS